MTRYRYSDSTALNNTQLLICTALHSNAVPVVPVIVVVVVIDVCVFMFHCTFTRLTSEGVSGFSLRAKG